MRVWIISQVVEHEGDEFLDVAIGTKEDIQQRMIDFATERDYLDYGPFTLDQINGAATDHMRLPTSYNVHIDADLVEVTEFSHRESE